MGEPLKGQSRRSSEGQFTAPSCQKIEDWQRRAYPVREEVSILVFPGDLDVLVDKRANEFQEGEANSSAGKKRWKVTPRLEDDEL